jgi:GAF domain-containing protein
MNLDSLLDTVALLDHQTQQETSASTLLEKVVPLLIPEAAFARVYRLGGTKAFLQGATRPGADFELDQRLVYAQALQQGEPMKVEPGLWVAPLHYGDEPFGLLEVGIEQDEPARFIDQVRLAATLLTPSLYKHFNQSRELVAGSDDALSLVQSLYETTNAVFNAEDLVEVLKSINQFVGGIYSRSRLGMLDNPDQPTAFHIIIEGDSHGMVAVDRFEPFDSVPAYDMLTAVHALLISDVDEDAILTEEERQHLQALGIRALLLVPLVVNQRQTGLLIFTHSVPTSLSSARQRALRSVADQLAIVLENRALLRSTAETLEETRTLYEINRAVVAAQDMLDLLRLIRDYLAPDSAYTAHLAADYDENRRIRDLVMRYRVSSSGEQVLDISMRASDPTLVDSFIGLATESRDRLIIEEDVLRLPVGSPLRQMGAVQQFRRLIAMRFFDQGDLSDIILVAHREPQAVDERLRRFYETASDQIAIVLQNQRLLRDAQVSAAQLSRQVRALEALNALATAATATREEKTLLDQSLRAMVTALNVDYGTVLMLETSRTTAVVLSEYPFTGALGVRLAAREEFSLRSEAGVPILVQDVRSDPVLTDASRQRLTGLGLRATLSLPLLVRDEQIGAITLGYASDGNTFARETIDTARTMAAQIGVGLQNIRLLTDTQRRAEQLQRIASFGQAVQATLDLQAILNIMLVETLQTISVDRIDIALYDPAQERLRLVARHEEGRSSVNLASATSLSLTEGYSRQVWQSQELLYIADAAPPDAPRTDQTAPRSLIVAPLRSRGRLLGLMNVGSVRAYAYSDTDVAVFQQMTNQLSVAIENAEAYAQSQRVAKNEALVNEISIRLQQQADIEQALNVAVNELGQVLNARRGRIRLHIPPDEPVENS